MFLLEPKATTIDEDIAQMRLQEQERFEAGLQAMKAVHAKGATLDVDSALLNKRCLFQHSVAGTIVKFSEVGELLGYYREGQKRGRPSRRMPLQVELDARLEQYFQMLRACASRAHTNKILTQRSVCKRQLQTPIKDELIAAYQELEASGIPKHHRAKKLALRFGCSDEYIRRLIRRHKLDGLGQIKQ